MVKIVDGEQRPKFDHKSYTQMYDRESGMVIQQKTDMLNVPILEMYRLGTPYGKPEMTNEALGFAVDVLDERIKVLEFHLEKAKQRKEELLMKML